MSDDRIEDDDEAGAVRQGVGAGDGDGDNAGAAVEPALSVIDLGEFCRRVEEHLTRVNNGQLIRIVGPAFELVRGWALEGVPLSIVAHGIDLKAERYRAGRATRPLRLEFCEADVRDVYTRWRRSVGLAAASAAAAVGSADGADAGEATKRPSLSKQLDRAIDKLSRVAGRLDLVESFREEMARAITELSDIRESARKARGDARLELAAKLPDIDAALIAAARGALSADAIDRLRADAEADLAPYRARVAPDMWHRTVDRALDQLIRDHLGLPTLAFDA